MCPGPTEICIKFSSGLLVCFFLLFFFFRYFFLKEELDVHGKGKSYSEEFLFGSCFSIVFVFKTKTTIS